MMDMWSKNLLICDKKMDPNIVDVPVRFDYTGAVQTYIVPDGCKKLKIDCVGGRGGYHPSYGWSMGQGGRVECILAVVPRQLLYLYIGAAGAINTFNSLTFNGGGTTGRYNPNMCGCGGGASDIRTKEASTGSWYDLSHDSWSNDASLLSRLVVAGGGGGYGSNGGGGYGGGLIGGQGRLNGTAGVSYGGRGGSQTTGGVQGSGFSISTGSGQFGFGGSSTSFSGSNLDGLTGSGGGGWYGGGYGGYSGGGGGGGGGSSYTDPTKCTNIIHTQGYSAATGNGWIILTPIK